MIEISATGYLTAPPRETTRDGVRWATAENEILLAR